MASIRIFSWLAIGAVVLGGAVAPAHALTTMQAPVNSDGSHFADPDGQAQNNFSGGQDSQSQKGFHFQVGPEAGSGSGTYVPSARYGAPNALTDPSSPYAQPMAPPMFWGPGSRR
jgi:hypothetical protein